jgi:hypothetical protein
MWIIGLFALVFAIVVAVSTLGFGLLVLNPIFFIDGFLGAGRANKKMIEKLLLNHAAVKRGEAPAAI